MREEVKQFASILILCGMMGASGVTAQNKAPSKAVNVTQVAHTAITRRILKDRAGQLLAVTFDTSASYPAGTTAKGVRGTGTLFNKRTGKQEIFAYDVQVHPKSGKPVKLSYSAMKGTATAFQTVTAEYLENMAHSVMRGKIIREHGKNTQVYFRSAQREPLASGLTRIKGEGAFAVGKVNTPFVYSINVDAANGRVSKATYRIIPKKTPPN